jgi:outer membrane protein
MKSKPLQLSLAAVVFCAMSALAQTGGAAKPATLAASPASVVASGTGTKIGTINIEQAIFGSNEGRRDFDVLSKKLEPKQNELKNQSDELESMKKQLQTQGDKLNEDALATLRKQIETKQKSFERSVQDAQEEAGNQQNEIAQRILQKMAPMIVKYAAESGFGVIMDTTKPWPQSPVLWFGETTDITKAMVEAYNVQSGVPAPAATATPKPAAPKPAGTTTKPAPKPTEPPK